MKRLALDTSSLACSVALKIGEQLFERHEKQAREHTRLLMPMIRDVLDEAGVEISTLDSIVLGNGPGSFIGIRIAASVCQGLAFGAGVPIRAVSSLAAVAAEVLDESDAECVAVTQDAHMQEVYFGLYARGTDNLPKAACEERLQGLAAIAELSSDKAVQTVAAGQGWQRYPALAAANSARLGAMSDVLYPRARYLLALSDAAAPIDPRDVEPAYLRHKVATKPGA